MMTCLKKVNRTLLEMWTGMFLLGLILWAAGFLLQSHSGGWLIYSLSLWLGIFLAAAGSVHMYLTLDRGLSLESKEAQKYIFRGYIFRYLFFVVIIGIIMITNVLNPLVVFMAYMTLKVTAFIQPFTHKFYNKLFHEEDPVPQSLEEIEKQNGESKEATQQEQK